MGGGIAMKRYYFNLLTEDYEDLEPATKQAQ